MCGPYRVPVERRSSEISGVCVCVNLILYLAIVILGAMYVSDTCGVDDRFRSKRNYDRATAVQCPTTVSNKTLKWRFWNFNVFFFVNISNYFVYDRLTTARLTSGWIFKREFIFCLFSTVLPFLNLICIKTIIFRLARHLNFSNFVFDILKPLIYT